MELVSIHIQIFRSRSQSGSSIFRDLKIGFSRISRLLECGGRKHTSGFNFSVRFQEEGKFNLPPIYRTEWIRVGAKAEEEISFAKNMQIFDYLGVIRRTTRTGDGTDWAGRKATKFQSKLKFDTNLFLASLSRQRRGCQIFYNIIPCAFTCIRFGLQCNCFLVQK